MKKITTKKAAPTAKSAKPVAKKAQLKTVPARPVTTMITALINIGFGNTLYLRGDGPGLSWDRGVLMDCVADDRWQIVLTESARPVVFKFLVNDLSWSAGEDYTATPGIETLLTPAF